MPPLTLAMPTALQHTNRYQCVTLAMPMVLSITATDDRNTVRLQTLDSAGLVSAC